VLAEWKEESVFVGYATAQRAHANYPKAQPSPDASRPEIARLTGIFQGFLRRKGFEFYDLDGTKWYEGTIDRSVQDKLPPEFDMTLGRGLMRRYRVVIRITRRGGRERHKLLDYEELPEPAPPTTARRIKL
jgi:hypothetical protein